MLARRFDTVVLSRRNRSAWLLSSWEATNIVLRRCCDMLTRKEQAMNPRTALAFAIFWGLHLLWLPLVVVGYVTWVGKLILYSRRSGASATVLASFYTRW